MSVQDPGAATGTGLYPSQILCRCDHPESYHAYGKRDGKPRRTYCSATTAEGSCGCREFEEARDGRP